MKIRINNIEIREYTSTKKDKPLYEIIKWYPNIYFGKEEYIKDGYVNNGDSLKKEKLHLDHSISKNAFTLPESCYGIAFIEKGSEDWQLRSVGERLLELTPEEWNDFHQVYTLGQSKINK